MGNKMKNKRTSTRRVATFLAALGVLVLSSGVALMTSATSANAADCVPQAAFTETINHPAVTHVVHHDAVAAVPEKWFNFAPTDPGKFDGTPSWPTDPLGKWEAVPGHANGGPGDGFGIIHQGQGGGSWFYRQAGVEGKDAFDETVVDTAASVETINHPAVTCTAQVSPPVTSTVVSTPTKTKAHHTSTAVTPTVVHAGLGSLSAEDVRGEQGLALMVAGMVMLVGAGGLRLRAGVRAPKI